MSFELANLAARYDRGMLIPFIGSGMSVPARATWEQMVCKLEGIAGLSPSPNEDPIRRSQRALESLRCRRANIEQLVFESIGGLGGIPSQTAILASIFWPLVCTTNYDDVYLRAVLAQRGRAMPQVFGRSEVSCRRVLQHLSMPVHEALWTLQGFLGGWSEEIRAQLPKDFDHAGAEREIVVGHAEYRRVANRLPHFRRSFAEVFRTRSFLFLGSGLKENYFLSLFDEIIELVGPPAQPHFALVPEGSVDTEFLLRHYHIICRTYPLAKSGDGTAQHHAMEDVLRAFVAFIRGERTRGCRWGYHLQSPNTLSGKAHCAQFTVQRQTLPEKIESDEALAISCGRERDPENRNSPRGVPLASGSGCEAAKLNSDPTSDWQTDSNWVVAFRGRERVYGIVARELIKPEKTGERSRDRRSPDAIREAFYQFLDEMRKRDVRTVYVQLLAAGGKRIFHPWVSLVQMARAYGEWHRAQRRKDPSNNEILNVKVCVVDPSAIAMLQGNFIDLGEQLEDTRLCLTVEVIHHDGDVVRHHSIVDSTVELTRLIPNFDKIMRPYPTLYTLPAIHRRSEHSDYETSIKQSVREFGLVSGSTLVVDYRLSGPSGPVQQCQPPS